MRLRRVVTTGLRALARTAGVALSAGLVLLATLPRDLQDHPHWQKVAWLPFSTPVRPFDLLGNVLLYVPLGFALQAAASRDRRLVAMLAGGVLSIALEATQVWSHSRFPSATDVVMNVVGVAAGAAWAFRRGPTVAAGARVLEASLPPPRGGS